MTYEDRPEEIEDAGLPEGRFRFRPEHIASSIFVLAVLLLAPVLILEIFARDYNRFLSIIVPMYSFGLMLVIFSHVVAWISLFVLLGKSLGKPDVDGSGYIALNVAVMIFSAGCIMSIPLPTA